MTLTHPIQLLLYTTTKLPAITTSGWEGVVHLLLPTDVGTLSGLGGSSGLPGLTTEPKESDETGKDCRAAKATYMR